MGRTRLAKALVSSLQRNKEASQKRKEALVDYLKKLNQEHANQKISGAEYSQKISAKKNGRSIKEWVEYYDNYSKNCEKAIQKNNAQIIRKRFLAFFFGAILLAGFIWMALSVNYSNIHLTGFLIGDKYEEQQYSQIIGLVTNQSTTYEWQLQNIGQLGSLKVNGDIIGDGEIKIYLNDLLILDSSKIKSKSSSSKYNSHITGEVIEQAESIATDSQTTNPDNSYSETETPSTEESSPSQEESLTETANSQTTSSDTLDTEQSKETTKSTAEEEPESSKQAINESYSEQEAPSKEDSSPSQEEPLTENNETETNISEQDPLIEINESITNQTESTNESYSEQEAPSKEDSSPSQEEPLTENNETETNKSEIETTIRLFTEECDDTCNLEKLNLTNSSYTLRIEIEGNATLRIGSIDYDLIQDKIPFISENLTEASTNLTEDITINTIQYQAVLGQPVKWKKQIELPEEGPVIVELPKDSKNIVVNKITETEESYSEQEAPSKEDSSPSQEEPLTEKYIIKEKANVNIELKIKEEIQKEIEKENKKQLGITGQAISEETKTIDTLTSKSEEVIEVLIEDNATSYEVEYETPAPYAIEEETEKGKIVEIIGPDTTHYENVLAFTELSESLNIINSSDVKIYWIEDNTYIPVNSVQDKNSNGIYDYVEWIVPHLSNQTFLITIQSDSNEGKDSYLNGGAQNTNYGTDTSIVVNYATGNRYRGLIEFDLSEVTSSASIVNANLTLYLSSTSGTNIPINIQRINQSWTEGEVTWDNRTSIQAWDMEGGDFDSTIWATQTVSTAETFYTWDITSLVQNWVNETYENYGIILMAGEGTGQWQFASSDNINATIRPQLNITYNESTSPVINSVSMPSTIREGENISLTANITDNLEVSNAVIEINNVNYSLGQNLQTVSNTITIRPIAKGTIETGQVLNYPNTYDNNNGTYAGINDVMPLLTVKTPGVSAAGSINSVKIKVIHSRAAYETSGSVQWAINSTTQGQTHEFNSTSSIPEITEFDVTSERAWTFSDFNLLTEIHINNSGNTLRIYEVWFEVNYTTPASNDLWNATIVLSELTQGNYTYTIYANDSSDNVGTETGNLTILPPLVLVNVSMNDAQGNFKESEVLIYNSENQEVEMNSTMSESQLISVEEGEKDIIIAPLESSVTKIAYLSTSIENYTKGIIDIDEDIINQENITETEAVSKTYALNPYLTTNATVTIRATGEKLYKCKDWNFTNQSCYGEWIKVMDLVPGEEYNITLNPEDPGFLEIVKVVSAYHLNSSRDILSDIYPQIRELDDEWSETIPDGDYARVTFELPLQNMNDITLYPRIVSGTPKIEVYEFNESTLIAEFNPIYSNTYNKVLLTNLTKSQDTFDLKIVGGDIEFDHVLDPVTTYNVNSTMDSLWGIPISSDRWSTGTNSTSSQYANMATENGVYASVVPGGNQDFPFYRFNFTVTESVNLITSIYIKFTGYDNAAETGTVYVWRFANSTWMPIGTTPASNGNITRNITSDISSYLDSNNNFVIIVEGNQYDTPDYLYIDYVGITVQSNTDSTSPVYNLNSTNNTLAGEITNFAINVSDNSALHPNGQYIFSTNNTGVWINDSFWQKDLTINASLPDIGTNSKPSVFYKDSSWYLISGNQSREFFGFAYNGTNWLPNSTINASLPDIGYNTNPYVFYKDSSWYLISGETNGNFYGFAWDGTQWLPNSTINASLPDIGISSAPSVFYKDSSWYLISGERDGNFYGFAWDGTQWLPNSTINTSLPNLGETSFISPYVFYKDSSWYLISGENTGNFYGFAWDGTQWLPNSIINASLSKTISKSSPSVFYKDSSWYLISGDTNGIFFGYKYSDATNFTATPSWANVTKKLNSTVGTIVGYRWYFNDSATAPNYNSTPIYTLITSEGASSDVNSPNITFEEPPTPENGSSTTSPVTIVANISDSSNTSSWIDFNRSLLWYISMDDYNSTHVLDNSSYKKNGTLYGAFNYTDANATTGSRGYARRFNGVNNYVRTITPAIGINASYTMSVWMNAPVAQTVDAGIISLGYSPVTVLQTDGEIRTWWYDGATYPGIGSPSTYVDGNWHHIATTFDGTTTTLYIDGNSVGASLRPQYSIYPDFYLGNEHNIGAKYFNGSIDEAMIFNRSLSQTEVKALYSSQINKFNTSSMNLDDGQHNYTVYAIDEYGNANNSGERNFVVSSGPVDCNTIGNSGILDVEGQTYILTSDITSAGTCLTVSAANVTIDCAGYWITFSTGGADGTRGISTNQFNTTIKNCNILDGNWITSNWWRAGVFFTSGSSYGLVENSFVNVSEAHGIDINAGYSTKVVNSTSLSTGAYGIIINDGVYNITLLNSLGRSNTSVGIGIFGGDNNTIYNCTGSSTYDSRGIYLASGSENNLISNSNFTSNYNYGIYLHNSTNNTFIRNNATSNSGSAIGINSYSSNNTFIDNNASTNSGTGIYILAFSNNNTLLRNNATTNSVSNPAIYIYNASYMNLTENKATSTSSSGIYIEEYSNNNTLTSNNGTSYAADNFGIVFWSSSNNILINNTGMNNDGTGIYLAGSSNNNTLINNTAISGTGQGVYIYSNYNNTLINQKAYGGLGVFIINANSTTFRDCVEISGTTFDVNLFSTPLSKNNTFINCSYDTETVGGTYNELIRKWYYQAYVNDTFGNAVSDANVTSYNATGVLQSTAQTNSSGWISRQEVTEYVNTGGTRSFYNNYTIFANKSGYTNDSNEFNFTITQNKVNDWFTLEGGGPADCTTIGNSGILDTDNAFYTLTENISSQGTCLDVVADNVTIDCNGYWINYSIGGEASKYGVITVAFNTTIKNCNIVDGNWTTSNTNRNGISLSRSENATVYNNYIYTNTSSGISLYLSNFSNLSHNRALSNNSYGISLNLAYNNNLINNTGTSNAITGILLYNRANNNMLINNTGIGTSSTSDSIGIRIYSSCNNNTLINTTGISYSSGYGLFVDISSNTTIINSTGTSNSGQGIRIAYSSYTNLINPTATTFGDSGTGRRAVYIYQSNHTLFRDCVNISGATSDIYFWSSPSINNTFINCSYDTESVNGGANELIRKWYYQAYVNNTAGSAVSDANVSAYNATGVLQSTAQTNSSGWISRQEVIEYVNNAGTRSFYNNYSITANKSGYINDSNELNFTVTLNKMDDWFTLEGSETVDCNTIGNSGSLDTDNGVYTLTGNISSQGTCLTVDADNVTLDCNGYWINYSIGGGASTYGVYSTNEFNTTVKNCNIVDGNWTSPETGRLGIYFEYSDNGTIFNNSVNINNSRGIYVYSSANYNNITNNYVVTNASEAAIIIYSSSNNLLINNTGKSRTTRGIDIIDSFNTYAINNNATSITGQGLRVYSSFNSTLINNTGQGGWYGFYIYNSSNSTFINNKGVGGDLGFLVSTNSSNNLLINNTGISSTSSAFWVGYNCTNNTFINATGISSDGAGIYIEDSSNLTFINSTGISDSARSLYVIESFNIHFINTTATSNSYRAIQLTRSENLTLSYVNATSVEEYALLMFWSNNTVFRDCVDISGAVADVYYYDTGVNKNNSFINCSYDTELISVEGSDLTRKWYYQAYVNDSSGNPVSDANVSAYNATGVLQSTAQTNASGWIQRQEVTEYVNNAGTRSYYNNYSIFANKSGYVNDSNELNFTVTLNKMDDWFTLESASECGELGAAWTNKTYTLNGNVSSQGTCFTITAANVTIDCAGHWINYSINGSANTRGVYTTQVNTTIRNCNIVDGNWSTGTGTGRYGIYSRGNNGTIFNNYINTNNSEAIQLSSADFNNLSNNIGFSNFAIVIRLDTCLNNNIINNVLRSNGEMGMYLSLYSNNTNIMENSVVSETTSAIYTSASNNLILIGNNATSLGSGYGIRISNSNNNTLFLNKGTSNTHHGINILSSYGNNLTSNMGLSNTSTGISLDKVHNNILEDNTGFVFGGSGTGFYIYLSSNNTFIRNNATAQAYGYYIVVSNYSNFTDCVAVEGGWHDVRISSDEGSISNIFLNCSYDELETVDSADGQLIRKWYYQAYVNDSSGNPVSDANVTAYNVSNVIQFTEQTNSSGWIQRKEVIDYINTGGTRVYWSNYTINASKTGYVTDNNVWNFTLQNNKINDWFTLLTSTCSYTSGNWFINCSESCIINTNYNVGGNNITIAGYGNVTVSANISNYNKLHIEGENTVNICRVRCVNGGCFKN